jgi:hypothetical protein
MQEQVRSEATLWLLHKFHSPIFSMPGDKGSLTRDQRVQLFSNMAVFTCNNDFYWDFYAPYFIEVKDKGLTATFSYIAFTSTNTPAVTEWMVQHKSETDVFFYWSAGFKWK